MQVYLINNLKVRSDLREIQILLGTITDRRGLGSDPLDMNRLKKPLSVLKTLVKVPNLSLMVSEE